MQITITPLVSKILQSNTYLIQNSQNAVLIDCSVSANSIDKVLTGRKINAIILTHTHYDHICTINEVCAKYGCEVYVLNGNANKLASGQQNLSCLFGLDYQIDNNIKIVEFADLQILHFGNIKIKTYATPGHSACAASFLIDNNLFSGDTLFKNGIGRFDLFDSSRHELKNSLSKIKDIKFANGYSGHGEMYDNQNAQNTIEKYLKRL